MTDRELFRSEKDALAARDTSTLVLVRSELIRRGYRVREGVLDIKSQKRFHRAIRPVVVQNIIATGIMGG